MTKSEVTVKPNVRVTRTVKHPSKESRVNRRQLLFSGSAALVAGPTAIAHPKNVRVGLMVNGGPGPFNDQFRESFSKLGYVGGQGFAIEPRYARGQLDRHPMLAGELVRLGVDVIMTLGGPASRAAKDATSNIPIVFSIVTDPVALGLVGSMDRPGGNATGVTNFDPEQAERQLELIRSVLPRLTRIGILSDNTIPGANATGLAPIDRANDAAARKLGMQPLVVKVAGGPAPDLAGALDTMVKDGADAVLVMEVPIPLSHRKAVAELAAARRLPTMFPGGQSDAGGVITYGTSVVDTWPRMPALVDKILKGADPGTLPVESVSRRELILNLKAAHAIGLAISEDIIRRADRIIE